MVILKRIKERDGGTFGVFLTPELNSICVSMELPWLENQHQVSCIPIGNYMVEQFTHDKLGRIFRILNVPDRDYIYMHGANWPTQIKGCIAPGMDYGEPNNIPGIIKSQDALHLLLALNPSSIQIINS